MQQNRIHLPAMLEHSCLGGMPTTSLSFTLSRSQFCERKELFTLFSDHYRSLIRGQPRAVTIGCTVSVMFPAKNSKMVVTEHLQMVVLCFICLLLAIFHSLSFSPRLLCWLMQVLAVMHSVCILMPRPRRYLPCWVTAAPQELLLYR